MSRKKGDGNNSDFIRSYDKEHGIQPALKLVEEGKKAGFSFGSSLVYEVRRRGRMNSEGGVKLLNGKGTPRSRSVVFSAKEQRIVGQTARGLVANLFRTKEEQKRLAYLRRQFVEAVSELGLIESKRIIALLEA
jgi:hypothetical protein